MPRYGVPRRARTFATGAITASATACAWSSGSTAVGENAPMPPVFAPVSPSPTRLWSRAGGSATTVSPSTRACSEASSPFRTSSSSTRPLLAGGGGVRERLPFRGRDARLVHELLRERLGPFDLRRLARRADHGDARTPKHVADARGDELVGTHDGEVDMRGDHVLLEPRHVVGPPIDHAREQPEPGVAGQYVDRRHAAAV